MSRRLILIRHAKSSWGDPLLPDHTRVLNARGLHAAGAVGDWLRAKGYAPDAVLSSSAARTRETATRIEFDVPATFLDALYHAGPEVMLAQLCRAEGACVMMLGHNPGIAEFADLLLAYPPGHARFADYPTAATLVADFDILDWADLKFDTGQMVDFIVPRDLTD